MIKEFCAENLTLLPTLDAGQVSRVELCDNLAVGGTTPSYG
ncbi:copper homeostasis protein CutC, partial [Streptococcus pyogenes]